MENTTSQAARVSATGIPIKDSIPMTGIVKMTADHLHKGYLDVAAVTVLGEVPAEGMVKTARRLKENPDLTDGVKVSFTHLLLKAVAQALKANPRLNATMTDDEIQILDRINIGMAVNLPDGNLIVPVIHDVDTMNIIEIARRAAELQEKAMTGKLGLADVQGGTFTLSNAGMLPHFLWSTPIINKPQGAILAAGNIRQTPVVENGELAIGWRMNTSLTYDHRLVHGYPAGLFTETLAEILEAGDGIELGL